MTIFLNRLKKFLRRIIFNWSFNFLSLGDLRLKINPFNMSTNLVENGVVFVMVDVHFLFVKKDFFVNFMMSIKFININMQISP